MDIEVVNIKTFDEVSSGRITFYIGRPSYLGNPFKLTSKNSLDEVLRNYREWLLFQVKMKTGSVVEKMLRRILKQALQSPIALACWCKPAPCHGDIIKEVLELMPTYSWRQVEQKWLMEGFISGE